MQLPNPNQGKKFQRIQGEYGYRTTDDGVEEIVHIPTDKSNMQYWQPEMVLDPSGCEHKFIITDIGKREIECDNCHYPTSFNAGNNYIEEGDKSYIVIKKKKYEILH